MNELDKLRIMLMENGIPFMNRYQEIEPEFKELHHGLPDGEAGKKWWRNQVIYAEGTESAWSGICQYGSYGEEEGLIESWFPLGWDEYEAPKTVTAKEAFSVIKNDWEKKKPVSDDPSARMNSLFRAVECVVREYDYSTTKAEEEAQDD